MGEIYVGVNNVPKKIKGLWVGVNGVTKNVKNVWIGVNGVSKIVYTAGYIVVFNANGGTVSETSRTVSKGSNIGTLPTPARGGYSFLYWTVSGTVINSNYVPAADCTALANWVLILEASYVKTVDHEGYVTWASATGATSYTIQKLENGIWYSGTETSNLYYDFTNFSPSTTTLRVISHDNYGNSVTSSEFSVKWVKLTFNANGGSCSTSYYNRISGEQIGSLPTPTRSSYTFDYWTAGSTTGSRVYTTSAYSTDMTLYAHWTASTVYYMITLDASTNGGSGGGSYSRASGTTFNLSSYSASKSSTTSGGYRYTYSFKGWYTAASGGTKTTSITVTGNKTYYAQFTESSSLILQKPTVSSAVKSTKTVKWNKPTGATKFVLFKSGNSSGSARNRSIIYANNGHKLSGSETIDNYTGTFLTGTSKTFGNANYMYEVCVVAYDDYGNHLASNWYTAT